ncbi:MAG: aminotransferase class V-fold PLP-dependent enzyme [Eubacteriales bacterium]|nr:aminotransferase class V-fold PLP-dependent enzyme [Eubacteriales bacterium]
MIYFDNAATTMKKPPQVSEAVLNALGNMGNSGRGAHGATLGASRIIYDTRVLLGELFGISAPERIAFTSNATEALNTAISGMFKKGDHVITTECEHNSVLRPLYRKEKEGVELTILPTLKNEKRKQGILDYASLENAVKPNTKAIVITHVSNLTGNITDLESVSSFAKKHGLLLVADASQSAGVLPLNVEKLGIDVLCFTGHKGLLGPQGTGGIYVREGVEIQPLKVGGSGVHSYDKNHPSQMPAALEAGTLNAHGIAGLHGALEYLKETGIETIRQKEMGLLKYFLEGVREIEGITLYGNPELEHRVATVALNIRNYDSGEVADLLWEEYEIAVRSGAHCAPLMHNALGTKEQGAVRFSFSHYNTKEETDIAIRALREIAEE